MAIVPAETEPLLPTADDWVQFNARQARKAARLVCSHPEHRLLIALVTMRVSVRILHHQESISSELFDQKVWEKGLKGSTPAACGKPTVGTANGLRCVWLRESCLVTVVLIGAHWPLLERRGDMQVWCFA